MLTKNNLEKKADMSIQVLIYAAIGLIILVVIIVLITGKVNFFNNNSPDVCSNCVATECDASKGEIKLFTSNCPDGQFCCKQIGSPTTK